MLRFLCKLFLAADSHGSLIADALRDDPSGWMWDSYWVVHGSGVAVWHANDCYGLRVASNDEQQKGSLWDCWKPSWAERRLIFIEVKRYRVREAARKRKALRSRLEEAFR